MLRRQLCTAHTPLGSGASVSSRFTYRSSGCLRPTSTLFYTYKPPGSREPSFPWYGASGSPSTPPKEKQSEVPQVVPSSSPSASTPLSSSIKAEAAAPSSTQSWLRPSAIADLLSQKAAATTAAGVAAVKAAVDTAAQPTGPLRVTPARRMAALQGPTLDDRVEDLVRIEEANTSDLSLLRVVQLLIDPKADQVETISMREFAAMQPKRQLMALGGRQEWLDWICKSSHYQQATRLAGESPAQDLAALQQAGISTLQQWMESPHLVRVSAHTHTVLDNAAQKSIEAFMNEVATVVNTSNEVEEVLNRWVSDVVGRFVLESLKVSVESASMQLWQKRGSWMPSTRAAAGRASQRGASGAGAKPGDEAGLLFSALQHDEPAPTSHSSSGGPNTVLRPGEACTLEHYERFVKKVMSSVRQDYTSASDARARGGAGAASADKQMELEIENKSFAIIDMAITQLLTQAVQRQLPEELKGLHANGYVALNRVPGLMKRAVGLLQLRQMPVRFFVFHSTLDSTHSATLSGGSGHPHAAHSAPHGIDLQAPAYAPGTFLTGSEQMDVTLGEWCGQPVPPSSNAAAADNAAQQSYFSVLHRMKRHVEDLSVTSLYEVVHGAERYGGNGFDASHSVGLDQLFGPAKLVEDRLTTALRYPPATTDKPVYMVEAGQLAGKTALLERLAQRTARPGEKVVLVRYGGTTTPFTPGLDDHPVSFAPRFWFRVALASCPYLISTEELFSRAPRSVMWWGHRANWSWERYQAVIRSARHAGAGHRTGGEALAQLSAVLVDDVDRALDSMERLWVAAPSEEAGKALVTSSGNSSAVEAAMAEKTQRMQALVTRTGKPLSEHLSTCFAQMTACLGQVSVVLTGERTSRVLLTHSPAPCRRYFLTVSSGVGLQARLRVLPLLATLHALHLKRNLEMPGLLYEVIKNAPGLVGKAMELFWTNRVAMMDLRTGIPRLTMGTGSAHPQLLQSYVPRELFAELPMCAYLLHNPRRSRRRLVELLQRQLGSPTGYLNTEVDTRPSDVRDGLVSPHNHTSSQVHAFALFTIFSRHDAAEEQRRYSPDGRLVRDAEEDGEEEEDEVESGSGGKGSAALGEGEAEAADGVAGQPPSAAMVLHSTGVGSNERKIVRAWAEVLTEYRSIVSVMATTPQRKRDAMRVLLHGALLLRSAAVAGAQLELNLKVPSYGFPLLSSEMHARGANSGAHTASLTRPATADTVRKAASSYKLFFDNAAPSHFPFRPLVGLNGGCDVVYVCGSTLALYDIATTAKEVQQVVGRFAEALLGVLHVLEKQILPADKIRSVQYVTVVSVDQTPGTGTAAPLLTPAKDGTTAPYFFDYGAVFEDAVMDRLRQLQQPLGVTKDYRTLNELIDDLERRYRVRVVQEVVSTPEEVEALFSPTLMQLVPDSTVLPPYVTEVLSADRLMVDAMQGHGQGGRAADEEEKAMMGQLHAPLMDTTDYINLGEEEDLPPGAELEDAARDARQTRTAAADGEYLHESAELLEAMLNDQLDVMTGSASRLEAARAQTDKELRRDLVLEDRINYNAPAPSSTASAPGEALAQGSPKTADAEGDALAWLHDIITPESLMRGLRGPGAAAAEAAGAGAASGPQGGDAGLTSNSLFAGMAPSSTSPWSPMPVLTPEQVAQATERGVVQGVESVSSIFPRTAAKRLAGDGASAPAPRLEGEEDGDEEGPEKGNDDEAEGEEEGEEEDVDAATADDEPLDLQKLFDRVGKAGSKAARQHQRRKGSKAKRSSGGLSKNRAGGQHRTASSSGAAKKTNAKKVKKSTSPSSSVPKSAKKAPRAGKKTASASSSKTKTTAKKAPAKRKGGKRWSGASV